MTEASAGREEALGASRPACYRETLLHLRDASIELAHRGDFVVLSRG